LFSYLYSFHSAPTLLPEFLTLTFSDDIFLDSTDIHYEVPFPRTFFFIFLLGSLANHRIPLSFLPLQVSVALRLSSSFLLFFEGGLFV